MGADQTSTGIGPVDQVLGALAQLEQRPLEEHLGVFERAHEELRRALEHRTVRHSMPDNH